VLWRQIPSGLSSELSLQSVREQTPRAGEASGDGHRPDVRQQTHAQIKRRVLKEEWTGKLECRPDQQHERLGAGSAV